MSTYASSQPEHKAFQDALDWFKKDLSPREIVDFEKTTLHSLKAEIIRIQADQERLRSQMHLERTQSFLEAMEQFGKVVDVFLNSTPFLGYVWGPMKFLLLVSSA